MAEVLSLRSLGDGLGVLLDDLVAPHGSPSLEPPPRRQLKEQLVKIDVTDALPQ